MNKETLSKIAHNKVVKTTLDILKVVGFIAFLYWLIPIISAICKSGVSGSISATPSSNSPRKKRTIDSPILSSKGEEGLN